MATHNLTFTHLVGNFTTDKELLGSQDPYVVFSSGSEKVQTKAIKNVGVGTAEWRESYTLNGFAPKSSTHLEVVVYNHNTLRPDGQIGSGSYDLSTLGESHLGGQGQPITIPLTDKKNNSVGTLKFQINGGGYSGRGTTGGAAATTGNTHGVGKTASHTTGGTAAGVGAAGAAGAATTGVGKHTGSHDGDRHVHTGTGTGTGTHTGTGHAHGATAAGAHGVRGEKASEFTPGQVIDRKYYTGTEDRPQQQALVENTREHNPYAVDYETTVQHTGRERLVGTNIDVQGTTERVVGGDNIVHGKPHHEIARNLPEGAHATRPGGEGWVQGKPGPICDSHNFSVQGDRTVDKERVTDLQEHRNFEKEFEVKTQVKGERELGQGVAPELLNRERVLVDEKSKNACAGHPDVPGTGQHTGHHTGHTHSGQTQTTTPQTHTGTAQRQTAPTQGYTTAIPGQSTSAQADPSRQAL